VRPALARASVESYSGIVWCITVPSGAFVARRNGTVFVTGNSGFPKSLDISKAIDKAAGAEREVVGRAKLNIADAVAYIPKTGIGFGGSNGEPEGRTITAPATDAAKFWAGFGTAIKPAHEPICLAQKPFKGTYAANVLKHGVGGLNVDGCRIPYASEEDKAAAAAAAQRLNHDRPGEVYKGCGKTGFTDPRGSLPGYLESMAGGRWPANVIVSDDAALGEAAKCFSLDAWERGRMSGLFVCPKPDAGEREAGLREAGLREAVTGSRSDPSWNADNPYAMGGAKARLNSHPTVKPVTLMRWLIRLVTPPGGTVLEPFAGSGTTAVAAIEEGCGYLAIEREAEYVEIAEARAAWARRQKASEAKSIFDFFGVAPEPKAPRQAPQPSIFGEQA